MSANDLGVLQIKTDRPTNIHDFNSMHDYEMKQLDEEQATIDLNKSIRTFNKQGEWSIEFKTPNKYLMDFAESNLFMKKKKVQVDSNHTSTPTFSNSLVLDVHINKKRHGGGGGKKSQTKDQISLKDWKARRDEMKNASVVLSSIVLQNEKKKNNKSKNAITEELTQKSMGKNTWLNQELPILQVEGDHQEQWLDSLSCSTHLYFDI